MIFKIPYLLPESRFPRCPEAAGGDRGDRGEYRGGRGGGDRKFDEKREDRPRGR